MACDIARRAATQRATRSNARCYIAACARPRRSARATWAMGVCTRPSFESMYCSESLFGALFMDTVHEHYSQGFQKIK